MRIRSALPLAREAACLVLLFGLESTMNADEPPFQPRTVIPRAFPSIVEPRTVTREEADADNWVRDDELVLGVVVEGAARAYPINTLTGPRREIINDRLGGRSIAATW